MATRREQLLEQLLELTPLAVAERRQEVADGLHARGQEPPSDAAAGGRQDDRDLPPLARLTPHPALLDEPVDEADGAGMGQAERASQGFDAAVRIALDGH